MKTDIILAGVGGQGILSIAAILGAAALAENLYLKQAETHGMSQRGGQVVSHLRISDSPVFSDLIPLGSADIILSVEPLESLRYLPYLKKEGCLVTNTTEFVNIEDYPKLEKTFVELSSKLICTLSSLSRAIEVEFFHWLLPPGIKGCSQEPLLFVTYLSELP